MHDFEPVMTVADFSEDTYAIAPRKRLLMARVEGKEAQHELRSRAAQCAIVFDQRDELATRPVLHVAPQDDAFRLHRITGAELRERRQMRMVVITQRQMQDEVFVPEDAQSHELRRNSVARFSARLFRRRL